MGTGRGTAKIRVETPEAHATGTVSPSATAAAETTFAGLPYVQSEFPVTLMPTDPRHSRTGALRAPRRRQLET